MVGKRPGRHTQAPAGRSRLRAWGWLAALAVPGVAVIAAAIWLMADPVAGATASAHMAAPVSSPGGGSTAAVSRREASPPATSRPPGGRDGDLALSPRARRSCPPAASACADLRDHVTWLQSDGRIRYGPVRMEPGAPADPTPRGIFHVAWKAGARYVSTSFGVPIPYAVFFAPGGIAFHAGSLTSSSHGCIHLALRNARYFHDHLPIGAAVDVF
jgi:L,D-transpeptidase catalytic domain